MDGDGEFEWADGKLYRGKFRKGDFHGIVEFEDGRQTAVFKDKK